MFLELVVEKVKRRLLAIGGDRAWEALVALEHLSPQELDVLAAREATD